jgi:tetratricopeptide (TPR) repeat protein/tRNA A-37 threonylcarbamoyl transferase component Bud32
MTTQLQSCSEELVARFLDGTLSDAAQATFESHLDHCERCREALDQAVASQRDWDELRLSLTTDGLASVEVLDGKSPTAARTDDLEFFRRLLSPSDDPRMLGRIANYEIVGLLGHGGMGVVFKGFDPAVNRYVAIKMMLPQFANSGAARQRFFREAQAAGAVVHEHVIAILCVSTWQEMPYLVMPYVRGISLQKRIDDEGALQLRELLRIGMQVASGLAAAHAQGLIHRDVKPANILMEEGVERVVLTDFGLARAVDDIRLTRTDTLVGTPQYMSPEQARDEPLDFRSDLFSLGSALYEAATGRPAFQAVTSYGVLRKINDLQPTPISELNPDIPDWFSRIVERLMAKSPSDRFASATEVAKLLRQCLAHVEQPRLTPLPASLIRSDFSTPFWFTRRFAMYTALLTFALGLAATMMPGGADDDRQPASKVEAKSKEKATTKYASAQEAFQIGAAFYNSRNFTASREPFEAVIRLAKDDEELKLKAYEALLRSYREIPEFEPFQTASEYIIANHKHDASRSLTRRAYLSFAYNRGQMKNIVARYEKQLKKDPNDWMAVYLLSEIYSRGSGLPPSAENSKRAIELLEHLAKLNAERNKADGKPESKLSPAEAAKISREKGQLAMQYMRARDYSKAADLYEEIASLDPTTHAWNLKEAATARLKLGDKENALRLALAAEKAPAEARNDQLTHFFERHMGDTFLALGKAKQAIPHYEIALKKTTIEGYVKGTQASLQEAIEKAKAE